MYACLRSCMHMQLQLLVNRATPPPVPHRPGDAEDVMMIAEANELQIAGRRRGGVSALPAAARAAQPLITLAAVLPHRMTPRTAQRSERKMRACLRTFSSWKRSATAKLG